METVLHDISWVVPLRSDALTPIFRALSLLGYTEFFLVMLPLGFWLWDKATFTRLAMLIGFVGITNTFLKDLFQDPRPPLAFALDARVGDSFGLPSGHAQIATAMWLWLAYEIRRTWAWIAAILIAAGVGASRIYLGVHDLEDVLGGTLLGLASFMIYRDVVSDQFKAWHDLNPALQLLGIAALAPLMWFAWPREFPTAMLALIAFMFFWWLGHAAERRWVNYARHPNWLVAGGATIAGIAVLFALMKVLGDQLTAAGLAKETATIIPFAISSLYVTAIAPALFRLVRAAA
jgi:glycerophosphoryl diester phosphodiesterase